MTLPTVGLDTSPLAAFRTGTEEVLEGLIGGLTEVGQPFRALAHPNRTLDPDRPDLGLAIRDRPTRLEKWRWEMWGLERAARLARVNVVHIPFLAHPPKALAVPTVVTVHDLIPYLYPGYQGSAPVRLYFARLRRHLQHATRFVAVSEATRSDIAVVFPSWSGRVAVIPNGVHPEYFRAPAPDEVVRVRRDLALPEGAPLLLYAAGYQPHKNVALLIQAARAAARTLPNLRLVLVGAASNPGISADAPVVKTPRLPRTHLRTLYHLATAVCCPSRYEGFGLPAAQGMACGAPVLASDIPAHREVLGDAADLLSPDSPGAWTDAILRMVQDPARRDRLARAGRQRAERYRWTQVAEQYRRLYGEVAGGQVAGA